jgi:hypothetical protein
MIVHRERLEMLKLIKFLLPPLLAILLCVVVLEDFSMASLPGHADQKPLRAQAIRISPVKKDRDLNKIIGILESRIKNHHLPGKAKNKLAAMNDEEIRLLTSLCDRLSETADTAGADFALLLATALIVLS